MLTTAPISSPPALPPWITSRSADVYLFLTRYSAQSMKSVKRVHLLHHASLLAPLLAELAAAANVGERVDHAAVEQAQTVRGERRRHRRAVGAVGIEQQRRRCRRASTPFLINERDRHLRAVAGRRPDALRLVVRSGRSRQALPAASAASAACVFMS